MTLDLSMAFGFDSKGFFIKTTGSTLPKFSAGAVLKASVAKKKKK